MDTDAFLDALESQRDQVEQMSFDQLADSAAPEGETPVPPARAAALPRPQTGPAPSQTAAVEARPAPAPSNGDAGVSGRHQDVRLFLAVLIKTFVEQTDSGLVREAPFQVRLGKGHTFEPDLVFVASAGLERVHETYVEGAPDLIVEVLSSDSTAADRGEKFVVYEAAGVREYWLIDPVRELINVYHLGPDGHYDEHRPDTVGRLRSRVLKNFVLDGGNLWRRVLPTTVETVEMVQAMIAGR